MRNHMAAGWFYSGSQIRHYLSTRVSSLRPPKTKLRNPYQVLRELTGHQWLMFLAGFISWVWDAFDFFSVTMTVTELASTFNVSTASVTWGITVTLMLRSVGALFFGFLADQYGRKYVMMANLFFFIVLELATGFCNTLPQFLGIRSLYGIVMGGLFGPAAATALEDLPYDARGLLSGLFEQGYGIGYVLAAAFYRALVPTTRHGWRSLFWFGAAPPILIIAFLWYLPETNNFQVVKAERMARYKERQPENGQPTDGFGTFLKTAGTTFCDNWALLVYMAILMSLFSFCSHGSQDFYPTFLKTQANLSATKSTLVMIIGQLGAIIGGILIGYISTFLGRRLAMLCACMMGAAVVPGFILPRGMSLAAGLFFEQMLVGGAWGPIPIHLVELSPATLRSLSVGITAQLGNLASSASATIQSTIAQGYPLPPTAAWKQRYDYGRVITIFLEIAWAATFLIVLVGPEMSQEERDEEAEAASYIERLRQTGVNISEIQDRQKGVMVEECELGGDNKVVIEHVK